MQRFFRPRSAAELSDSVHHQLRMYALAASAAGLGVVFTPPAEAEIIYTPANQSIGPITYLDLNHDGINDFKFTTHHTAHNTHGCASGSAALAVYGVSPAKNISGESAFASALPPGGYVGPAGKFRGQKMAFVVGGCTTSNGGASFYGRSGFWAGPAGGGIEHRYLGLKFTINGEIHFGWARLKVVISSLTMKATLTGYAYETIPNKRIIAGATKGPDDAGSAASLDTHTPAPAMLGALALGAPGLSIWRRAESVGTPAFRND